MEKIKRTEIRTRSGLSVFFKTVLVTVICIGLIVLGYFAAGYFFGGV